MSTLNEPVYVLNPDSELHQLFFQNKVAAEKMNKVMRNIRENVPSLDEDKIFAIWSNQTIGIQIGSLAEKEYDSQLLKKEKKGYRILKKNSELLKTINEIGSAEINESNEVNRRYRFELATRFGINNTTGTHLVKNTLYISFNYPPKENQDELESVSYSKYIKAYASTLDDNHA